jgi:ribosomal protein S18 acetylase RimI-like enzyme
MVLDGTEQYKIRAMKNDDLQAIVDIDTKVLGRSRSEYWEMKLELADKRSPLASLVAEAEGKVVGFILGDASGWEYGIPESVGWIDTIGIHPDYQRKGVARALMNEIIANLKKVGVNTIYTFVNWRDWGLLQFFDAMGFTKGDMINLELKV